MNKYWFIVFLAMVLIPTAFADIAFCTGTAKACSSYLGNQSGCLAQAGCTFAAGSCTGTPASCSKLTGDDCDFAGCTSSTSGGCYGNPNPCSTYNTTAYPSIDCSISGCTWKTGGPCTGTAKTCSTLTSEINCKTQNGCTWTTQATPAPTATPTQYCGDGSCNGSETCTSCAHDCGACKTPTPTPAPATPTPAQSKCSDGTLYGTCSTTKPKYCMYGTLINNYCATCGCPQNYTCKTSTGECTATTPTVTPTPTTAYSESMRYDNGDWVSLEKTSDDYAGGGSQTVDAWWDSTAKKAKFHMNFSEKGFTGSTRLSIAKNLATEQITVTIANANQLVETSSSYAIDGEINGLGTGRYKITILMSTIEGQYTLDAITFDVREPPATPAPTITPPPTPAPTQAPIKCIDTDGGKNYFVKGVASAGTSNGEDRCCNIGLQDICEAYCDSNGQVNNDAFVSCEYGCSQGACLTKAPTCTDTDRAQDPYVKGYATIDGGITKFYDQCGYEEGYLDRNMVMQAYCDGYLLKVDYKTDCPNGCLKGVCLPSSTRMPNCTETDSGRDAGTRGKLSTWDASGKLKNFTDYCDYQNPNILNEYYCEGDVNKVAKMTCDLCRDGACVSGNAYETGMVIDNLDGAGQYAGQKVKLRVDDVWSTDEADFTLLDAQGNEIDKFISTSEGTYLNQNFYDLNEQYALATKVYLLKINYNSATYKGNVVLEITGMATPKPTTTPNAKSGPSQTCGDYRCDANEIYACPQDCNAPTVTPVLPNSSIYDPGAIISGLAGAGEYKGQQVKLRFDNIWDANSADFTLLDVQGNEISSFLDAREGDYLNQNFYDSNGNYALKTNVKVVKIRYNPVTYKGNVELKINESQTTQSSGGIFSDIVNWFCNFCPMCCGR